MGYRDYSTAKGLIVDSTGHGDFTTIQAAINAASSGQTIFIRPGSYVENLALKAGVILFSFGTNVVVTGKCTFSSAGSVVINGLSLVTNSDYLLSVTGSSASVVTLVNCFLSCSNNTGINFTSSSSSAEILLKNCTTNLGTTGISLFTSTSPGEISISQCNLNNSGSSTTASSTSSGTVAIFGSSINIMFSTSGTGVFGIQNCQTDVSFINSTFLTTAGTGFSNINFSTISSGTASCISIGSGTTVACYTLNVNSSNAHVLTGAGTLSYAFISFDGSSSGHNVTTETAVPTI